MSDLMISIDLGTTRLKVAAYHLDGTLAHLFQKRHEDHELVRDSHTRRWQYAEGWWTDAVNLVRQLLNAVPDAQVLGISLSGRGGAAVFADQSGEVIVDPWADNRHREQTQRLVNWRNEGAFLSNYGMQLIAKYLWLREHHPDAASEIHRGFYAKDWLLFRLTGEHITDWTSGPDAGQWDSELQAFDLPDSLLPRPELPWSIAGTLSEDAAAALNLPSTTPVAVGAHDGLAANIGAGAIEPGQFAITLGTHAVVRAVQNDQPAGSYRFYGFPPDRHIIGGNAVLAGRSADWFIELLEGDLTDAERGNSYLRAEERAARVSVGSDGVRFLPFLAGQVAPEARPAARALFAGLGLAHGSAELYRGVLEGSSFAVKGIFDQVSGWCGSPSIVRATGGGTESPLWMEILANIIDEPVELTGPGVEGRGAIMCLAVALGIHADLAAAAQAMVRVSQVVVPEPSIVAQYADVYLDWSRLNELSRSYD